MKSKQQKRLEAIERLERAPRPRPGYFVPGAKCYEDVKASRLTEAARLRKKFGLNHQNSEGANPLRGEHCEGSK